MPSFDGHYGSSGRGLDAGVELSQHDQALLLDAFVSYRVRELRKVAEGHGALRYPVLIFGRVAQFGLVVVVHVVGHGDDLLLRNRNLGSEAAPEMRQVGDGLVAWGHQFLQQHGAGPTPGAKVWLCDFLLPPEAFAARRHEGELGLAVTDRFEEWRAERTTLLEIATQIIDTLASTVKLVEAASTAEGLSISPIRKDENDKSDDVARRLYGMLLGVGKPHARICEGEAERPSCSTTNR